MITTTNPGAFVGSTAFDSEGEKIGKIGQIYVDPDSGQPNWATIHTGFFGTSESFVPLDQATQEGEDIHVPYTKDFVKGAPRVEADNQLEAAEEETLHSYYYGRQAAPSQDTAPAGDSYEAETVAQGTDAAMTRSEERLHVGTEQVEAGRARLHKYVVTEDQTVTVPVSHEEVRLEREPITDIAPAAPAEIGEEDQEVVLTEERPVVQKETVPVERVSLGTETVTENQAVTEQVQKEEIAYDESTAAHRAEGVETEPADTGHSGDTPYPQTTGYAEGANRTDDAGK